MFEMQQRSTKSSYGIGFQVLSKNLKIYITRAIIKKIKVIRKYASTTLRVEEVE